MAFAACVATAFEQRRPLPVDAMVPDPLFTSTHAITIDAPPDQAWPWIAQMGAGRAGWYSWDAIDNGGTPSARRVVPELQPVIHFPMQRKQLIGIARRAELTMSRASAFKTADRQAACAR